MVYRTPSAPVRTSLDIDGTPTVNAGRYADPNCRLRLNAAGQPLAIRRIVALGQPGSFASTRYQVVKHDGITALSGSALRAWENCRSHPVN